MDAGSAALRWRPRWWRARRRPASRRRDRPPRWSSEAIASGLRRGPARLLFGQQSGLSWSWIRLPRITNGLSDAQAVSGSDQVVRGDRLRGPLLRAWKRSGWSLFSCPASRGRESLAHAFSRLQSADRARIARPDGRRRGLPRRARRPPDRGPRRRPRRSPSGARRPSSRRSSASASSAIRRRGKFLLIDLDRDAVVVNPMLTGRFQLAAPGDEAADEDRGRPRVRAARRRRRPMPRAGRDGAAWLPGRRRRRRGPLPGPDPDGQGLPAAGRRGPAGRRARRRRAGPRRRRPGADPRRLARADPAAPGRAQEPAAEPGLRGRHRQRLQRRDPARGAAAAVPQAVEPGGRGGRRALRGDAVDARRTRSTILRERVPPTFETQVRDFLAVHNKGGQPCPRCGTRITEVKAGGFITSYCRGCQR